MNTKTVIAAALASVFAITAAAPSFAAGDPAKHEKRIHRMIHRADTNKDGRVSQAEMDAALAKSFAVLDTNHDGVLSKAEVENRKATYKTYRVQLKAERKSGQHVAGVIRMPKGLGKHFAAIDANKDGFISRTELASVAQHAFQRRDHNKDGYISAADFKA
jgi:Ca2+-binding EF-hand superfamily protein